MAVRNAVLFKFLVKVRFEIALVTMFIWLPTRIRLLFRRFFCQFAGYIDFTWFSSVPWAPE